MRRIEKYSATAIARAVLFRRMWRVLIRALAKGIIATTLNFDYEVRSSNEAFKDVAKIKVEAEMLDLAKHIINTRRAISTRRNLMIDTKSACSLVEAKRKRSPFRSRSL